MVSIQYTPNCETCRILLVHPSTGSKASLAATLAPCEHLGLAYVSAALRLLNRDCRILDLESSPLTPLAMARQVKMDNIMLVGFSPTSLSVRDAIDHLHAIKTHCPNVIVIWGGHMATGLGYDVFTAVPPLDAVVVGDGVSVINVVAEAVERYQGLPQHPQVLVNPSSTLPLIRDYPATHVPSWTDLLPTRVLSQSDYERHGARLLTSLGCPYNCVFCTTPFVHGARRTLRPLAHVISEVRTLHNDFGVTRLWINDDLFLDHSSASHERACNFAKHLHDLDPSFRFRVLVRADSFGEDASTLDTLVACGMDTVFIGIESGDDNALAELNKHANTSSSSTLVRKLRARNVRLQSGFIMFTPQATPASLRRNVQFLYDIGELYRLFPTTRTVRIFPGTLLWHSLRTPTDVDESRSTPFLRYPRFLRTDVRELSLAFESLEEDFAPIDATMYALRIYGGLSNETHHLVSCKIYDTLSAAIAAAEKGAVADDIRELVARIRPELQAITEMSQ